MEDQSKKKLSCLQLFKRSTVECFYSREWPQKQFLMTKIINILPTSCLLMSKVFSALDVRLFSFSICIKSGTPFQ